MRETKQKCDGCCFFHPRPWLDNTAPSGEPDGPYGDCRRNPPKLLGAIAQQHILDTREEQEECTMADAAISATMFPVVTGDMWCGFWREVTK